MELEQNVRSKTWKKCTIKIYLPWYPLRRCVCELLMCEIGIVSSCLFATVKFVLLISHLSLLLRVISLTLSLHLVHKLYSNRLFTWVKKTFTNIRDWCFWFFTRFAFVSFFCLSRSQFCWFFQFSDVRKKPNQFRFFDFKMRICNTTGFNCVVRIHFKFVWVALGLLLPEQSTIEWYRIVWFTPYLYKTNIQSNCTRFELPMHWKSLTWFQTCDTNAMALVVLVLFIVFVVLVQFNNAYTALRLIRVLHLR